MLKSLDTKNLINWKLHKTNHDYEIEIADTDIKADFISLTRYFEYIIYGNFSLDEAGFNKAQAIYKQVLSRLQQSVLQTQN
jgi:hypothetical protein